jgi:hypothetical protein
MRSTPLLVALALLLALPAAAPAAEGTTEIDLGGRAVERLRAQGVELVAKRPAKITRGELRLPVRQGLVSSVALLNHRGALHLRKGKRVVKLTRIQSRLGSASYVNANVGDRRLKLLTLKATPSLNSTAGTASARDARATLTRAAARAIKRGLKLRRLPSGRFGRATVDALVSGSSPSPGGGPTQPGGGPPQSGPIDQEPPVLARPAGAVDLLGASVVWHVRDAWIRYVSTEKPVAAIEGAVAGPELRNDQHPCPDSPSSAAPDLVYTYTLPFAHGWHDEASGQTAIYTTGGTHFSFPSHGIDLVTRNLEVELTGASSRVIARFGTQRGVFFDLAAPAGGLQRGSIPEGGSEGVFAGFYQPGTGFGCVSVSYSF